ncbi:MAG: potassium channel family protein, partial [Armatimonadota bacterium]|nr:potassium channel family protein [Armatimonadota bacterium]
MSVLASLFGAVLILVAVWDMFEAVILPRTVSRKFRLSRLFYRSTWWVSRTVALGLPWRSTRVSILSSFGPFSLPLLLGFWAFCLILGFALVQWGLGPVLGPPSANVGARMGMGAVLYWSGTTFFTLGYGDIVPHTNLSRILAVLEAGVGFGFLAIVISYLPVLYQSFSRREVGISLLDSRAGSP